MNKQINKQFRKYTKTISTRTMAISLELATYMWKEINERKSVKILDLGNGFSSFVFRYYQKNNAPDNCRVISVDTSKDWLVKSTKFLSDNKLSTDEIYTFDEFKILPKEKYDFILYDLGNMITRGENLPYVLSLADVKSPVIVDDVHKLIYSEIVEVVADNFNKSLNYLKDETLDDFGRYASVIV